LWSRTDSKGNSRPEGTFKKLKGVIGNLECKIRKRGGLDNVPGRRGRGH